MVHFPIGLLIIALVFEIFTLKGKRKSLRDGITLLVYFGTAAAICSSIFGYILNVNEAYGGELVLQHQKLGIATSILSSITALLIYFSAKNNYEKLLWYRIMLLLTVVSVSITGHLGASLTHGENYIFESLGEDDENYDLEKLSATLAELNGLDSLSESQQENLNLDVRAILAHNCYQCHSEYKMKGELALDSKEAVFKGGESGKVIVSGLPNESELYKRITLPSNHKDVMPKKGKTLKKSEIELIQLWITHGAYWSDRAVKVFDEAPLALSKPNLPAERKESHPVDKIMGQYFEENNITWPEVIDDRAFIRRTYLDLLGLLPSPEEVAEFISDTRPAKREQLIEELLLDQKNYTEHWLSFWNDLLRNDYSGPGFITGGRKQITDWLYASLMDNKSYDQMMKELVNPSKESEGFIKGIQWRGVVNASQRTEMQAAQNIGQSLMGVNVKCASCHNSFVINVTLKQAYGFASIFADTLMELNRCDKPTGVLSKVSFLYGELGSVDAPTVDERLELLSEVMVKPENGRLYRTFTNRIWKILLGRGIVEPVDEMDNPPWNEDLLDWLASDFIDSGTDIKHLLRTIMTSKTYQLKASKYKSQEELKIGTYVFNGPVMRRMSAEQFSDGISQVISPMFYGVAYDPNDEGLSARRIWHREIKFDRDVLPEPGKRYFRHQFELSNKEIISARALISVDHSFVLYINGQRIAEGQDWRKVHKVDVLEYVKPGKNLIAIEATNEGNLANPAGVLFAMKIENEAEHLIEANTSWISTDQVPNPSWTSIDYDAKDWKNVKNYGSNNWDKLLDFKFEEDYNTFTRASLVKQHPFLKALGRPSRENVATSRESQATLLQALELTNGEFLSATLEEGAEKWLDEYGEDAELIVEQLFQKVLSRSPTASEKKTMLNALGDQPNKESIQDLFWTILMLPEFQFIS
ncbi:hypothetical protein GCM10007940_35640 [Portibacter lacus]|uniref:DUF1553 domain-containing protein n=2 Tax=Portibacter lacus TaxID=1099794 RepID=A0AA37SVN5_9BACT|nr:hypothetical protein GCM10007940_35640 [Portibacter lacus]